MPTMTRRRLLQSGTGALAWTAFAGRLGSSEADSDTAVTLRTSGRTIEVHGKSARVYGISQANGIAGLFAENGKQFRRRSWFKYCNIFSNAKSISFLFLSNIEFFRLLSIP